MTKYRNFNILTIFNFNNDREIILSEVILEYDN